MKIAVFEVFELNYKYGKNVIDLEIFSKDAFCKSFDQ
jgi:hypothetical protein